MKKIITGMALLLVTTLSAFSQTKNITVSGRVVEDTKEPAIQATVQLLLLPDSVQASGTATTAQGYFTLPKVSAGISLFRAVIASILCCGFSGLIRLMPPPHVPIHNLPCPSAVMALTELWVSVPLSYV